MFDIFAKLLSSIVSTLFPLFASYKALKTSDPAQLTPWLMYWVVLACALFVESWTEWILVWIPLYPYLRLFFLLYLVLPQTQGARIIYTTYVHPYLEQNEGQIEELIATAHDNLRASSVAYIKRAIELLRTRVLGLPPSPDAQRPNVPASQRPRSYTQGLLERFQLPQARWPGNAGGSSSTTGQDVYNLLSSAVNAAAAAVSDAATGASGAASSAGGSAASASTSARGGLGLVGAFPGGGGGGDLSASGTLVPPNIRDDAEKMTFLAAQRERLNIVLGALDREAAQLRSGSGAATPAAAAPAAAPEANGSGGGSVSEVNPDGLQPQADRPATSHSGRSTSGLSKSRSEVDFEKIEAESGAEDNSAQDAEGAKGTPTVSASGGGSWLPWGWGASSSSSLSGTGKNKSE